MRILLDTQVFLWMNADPERLGSLRRLVAGSSSQMFLSAASSWEIAIKHGLGRLRLPEEPDRWVPSRMAATGVDGLAITHGHALAVASLPQHHKDPFDRILVAQGQLESLTLATADPVFERYTDDIIGP